MYGFLSERMASSFLCLTESNLRKLRKSGTGPKFFVLPNGKVRYRPPDLELWATQGDDKFSMRFSDHRNVVPFPGVRLLRSKPVLKPIVKKKRKKKRKLLYEYEVHRGGDKCKKEDRETVSVYAREEEDN